MRRKLYIILSGLFVVAICLFLAACAVVRQPRFGTPPQGDRLARIESAPNYADGTFQNEMPTPKFSEDVMTPEEAARAAVDLGARVLMPAHVGRFAIANHAWDEPFSRLAATSSGQSYRLLMPRIGAPVTLDEAPSRSADWWAAKAVDP